MIIDEATLAFAKYLSDMVSERLDNVSDTNILKKPMKDFCEFVSKAKVGDTMQQYMASFISATNLIGMITTEVAEEKLAWLKQHGVYGAWEKEGVLEFMRGKSAMIDSWALEVSAQPGDLIIPVNILEEWGNISELAKLEPVGGVQ